MQNFIYCSGIGGGGMAPCPPPPGYAPACEQIHTWIQANQLKLNANETKKKLFTPDPAQYNTALTLTIDNTTLPTVKHPKILGLTLDPKLTYSQHIHNNNTTTNKVLNAQAPKIHNYEQTSAHSCRDTFTKSHQTHTQHHNVHCASTTHTTTYISSHNRKSGRT